MRSHVEYCWGCIALSVHACMGGPCECICNTEMGKPRLADEDIPGPRSAVAWLIWRLWQRIRNKD